jgi:hypothetical protein
MDKKNIIRALSLFLLIGLAACSGSKSTDSGDIKVASGSIIGFGSVIVNGVEFSRKPGLADDRVTLGFENITSASEKDLRIGMTVNIRGTINNATSTGEYESIEFQPELRGPLDSDGVDTTAGTLTVMGRTVKVDTNSTNFESISSDLATIKSELQAGKQPELEISGNLDNRDGVLHATRIARKAPDFNALPVKIVQIKGNIAPDSVIGGASSGTFAIGTAKVNFTAAGLGSNPTIADIASGSVVEVKGVLNENGTITASQIKKKNPVDAVVNDIVKIKGISNGGAGGNTFTIDGPNGAITVNIATASFQKDGAAATPAITTDGATLEIEGILRPDGSVAATKVNLEVEKTVKLEGNTTEGAFNAGTQVLTLNGVPVTIISATTRLLDEDGLLLDPASIASIASGTHLQIVALFNRTTNKVTASQVQIITGNKERVTIIQGPVTATASPKLTLMGTIIVDTSKVDPALDFGDNRTGTVKRFSSQDVFFAALTCDGFTTVKAKGTIVGTTMSANEVELEPPQ